jgi:multiple sugar transport system substrate-binding protein
MDIFAIILLLVIIITPLVFNGISRLKAKSRRQDIYISARCEDFFGGKTMETLTRDFKNRHPDFWITLLSVGGEKNREPDILFFDEVEFNALAADGTLLPFDSFFDNEDGGQIPAVPLVSFMDLLFYNIELLQAAGFDRPPKTRDEYLEYMRAISPSVGGVPNGAGLQKLSMSRDVFSWIWAGGGDFWTDPNSAPVINTARFINDFNFFEKLYRVEANMTGEQAVEGFAQGKIAMIIASSRNIPVFREKMGDDAFGITTIPGAGTVGKYNVCLTGIFAGINKNCPSPGAAMVFLEFLAEQSPLLCAQLKAVPGHVRELIGENKNYLKEDPLYAKAWDIYESSAVVRGFWGFHGAREYEDAVREELGVFLKNGGGSREAANAIQRRWDGIYKGTIPQN